MQVVKANGKYSEDLGRSSAPTQSAKRDSPGTAGSFRRIILDTPTADSIVIGNRWGMV